MKRLLFLLMAVAMLFTACNAGAPVDTQNDQDIIYQEETPMEEQGKLIALTFDDGPNTTTMVEVLDILEEYDAVATFFLIGNFIDDASGEVMKRAYDMGCEMGNHTWSHGYTSKLSAEEIEDEIKKTQRKVRDVVGESPDLFRPPYLDMSQTMYDVIDLPFIGGFSSKDWDKSVSPEERTDLFFKQCEEGKIAVLHCFVGNDNTVEALKTILPRLIEEGYTFVTVSELFEAYDLDLEENNGILYASVEDAK